MTQKPTNVSICDESKQVNQQYQQQPSLFKKTLPYSNKVYFPFEVKCENFSLTQKLNRSQIGRASCRERV